MENVKNWDPRGSMLHGYLEEKPSKQKWPLHSLPKDKLWGWMTEAEWTALDWVETIIGGPEHEGHYRKKKHHVFTFSEMISH